MKPVSTLVALLLLTTAALADLPKDGDIKLLPWPQKIDRAEGSLQLTRASRIVATDPSLTPLAEILSGELHDLTGTKFAVAEGPANAGDIVLAIDPTLQADQEIYTVKDRKFQRVRDYAHTLTVTDRVAVTGFDYRATAEGTATLLQLIRRDLSVPRVAIKDWPYADFMGGMIDVARQEISIEALKQCVVSARVFKVRYVHLHLSDDHGWSFPSTAYPRAGTLNRGAHGGKKVLRYDLQELKDLVAFADARGVTLVPEIETPGHSDAIRIAYPEIFDSVDPETGKLRGLAIMNMVNPKMYEALDTIVGEVCEVFKSSPYFHIGCDETNWRAIEKAPEVRAYLAEKKIGHGDLFKEHVLKMNEIVKKYGKQTIIWEGGANQFSKEVICMTWEGGSNNARILNDKGFTTITVPWTMQGVPEYKWTLFNNNSSLLTPKDNVIGAMVPMWEMSEIELVHSKGYNYNRYAIRQDGTWNPLTTREEQEWEARKAYTMELAERLNRPVRLTAEGVTEEEVHRPTVFLDTVTLTMENLLGRGEIHYTLDGTEPTAQSPKYTGPVQIRQTSTLIARIFDDAGRPISFRTMGHWNKRDFEKNLTTGKPIKADPGVQDRYKPEFAVDGRPDTAWWAGPGPKSITVDLEKVYTVDRIDVFPYYDNRRYYGYTVQVSEDGENWVQVVDMLNNKTPHTAKGDRHDIKPTPMRFVKVTLVKNSANEAVHLAELRVYEVGKHPQQQADAR